jgi:hypothetical protein
MIDQDRPVIGGFGGSIRSMMSPGLQRRLAEQEAAEAKEGREQERERALRAEVHHEASIQAAIAQALEQGQEFNPRMLRGEGLGRTVSESLAYYSAVADAEDRRRAAQARRAFNEWQARHNELHSADMSAPSPEELQSRAESEARHNEARIQGSVRRYEANKILKQARKDAWHAAIAVAAAAERHR